MSAPDVFSEALSLPVGERARLAHDLLTSLDETRDPGAAEAWLSEIDRRSREVEAGVASTEAWETVRARLTERWSRR